MSQHIIYYVVNVGDGGGSGAGVGDFVVVIDCAVAAFIIFTALV